MSKDTSKLVWYVPFGEGWFEEVHKIHESDCLVMRSLKQYRTIGETRGTSIAWLRAYVITLQA